MRMVKQPLVPPMPIKSLSEVAMFSPADLDSMEADIIRLDNAEPFKVNITLSAKGKKGGIPRGAAVYYHSGFDIAARLLAQVRSLQAEVAELKKEREVLLGFVQDVRDFAGSYAIHQGSTGDAEDALKKLCADIGITDEQQEGS